METHIGYGQNREDLLVMKYFDGYIGSLLDIGCNDAKTFSNSLLLIENGWQATLVDASEGAIRKAEELHRGNDKVEIINVGVSTSKGTEIWYELSDSLLSTKNEALAKSWGVPYDTIISEFNTYEGLFYGKIFDFISIDAELEDWAILQQINLNDVKCLCIEYGAHKEDITRYCGYFGMKVLHTNGENIIFVK